MNTNTGEIRALMELSEAERSSGEWVPVSDNLARAAETVRLEAATHREAEIAALQRQYEEMRARLAED